MFSLISIFSAEPSKISRLFSSFKSVEIAKEAEAREWEISLNIERAGNKVFEGKVSVNQNKRSFDELSKYMNQSQEFPFGSALLTGTGIVPDDDFTLIEGDTISIYITGIGCLKNSVISV